MFFKDLKSTYPVYILDRSSISVSTPKVIDVSLPHVDAKIGGATSLVVDVTADDGNTYVVMSDCDVAYPEGKVISTELPPILREINAMKSGAEQSLRQVDVNKEIVTKCNNLLADLDPVQRERQQTEARFTKIEDMQRQMYEMLKSMTAPSMHNP